MAYTPPRPAKDAPPIRINLYSDTQTRPTPAMKEAMLRAEVGDEQHGNDPTVHALCDRVAALLGKEAAVFLPSGTMCNVIALRTHCRAGEEVVAHQTSHILTSEGGSHAALTGVQIFPLSGAHGRFTAADVRAAIRPRTRYAPKQALLEVEQTANIGGGAVWPLAQLDEVAAVAHGEGWATHMDGARLMNAQVASGVAAKAMAGSYDSVWLDFTKGLGAPPLRQMVRHILPNAMGPVIVAGTIDVAAAIIAESSLSFLGLGFPPDIPSWGRILFDAKDNLDFAPHWALFAGAAIFLTVLSISYIGDGLRDALDPRKVLQK